MGVPKPTFYERLKGIFIVKRKGTARTGSFQSSEVTGDMIGTAAGLHPLKESRISPNDSTSRRILETTIGTVGPFTLALAEGIPIAGGPLKAAIGGLLVVLSAVNARLQNNEDAQELQARLLDLDGMMAMIPPGDPATGNIREKLISRLNDTSATLQRFIHDSSSLRHQAISSQIRECKWKIESHILEFSALNSMQQSNRIYELSLGMINMSQQLRALEGRVSAGSIQLIDATGHSHPIPVHFALSLAQFKEAIRVCFRPETLQGRILRRYMDAGEYDLCFREEGQVREIRDETAWTGMEPGKTVTMRIILAETIRRNENRETYTCPSSDCKVLNSIQGDRSSLECGGCGRWFQITTPLRGDKKGRGQSQAPFGRKNELDLIRNVRVRQTYAKQLAFDTVGPEHVFAIADWDRTPSEPTRNLSYQDILELKEIQRSLPHAIQPADLIRRTPAPQYLPIVPVGLLPLFTESDNAPPVPHPR